MKKTVTLIINKKCIITQGIASISIATRTPKSRVFHIPLSQIESIKESEIAVNDAHKEPAMEYQVSAWIFTKIKEDIDIMLDKHAFYIMPETQN